MNTRAVVQRHLRRVRSLITITASLASMLPCIAAAGPSHPSTADIGSLPDPSSAVRELPAVPGDLAAALSSPEVTAALGSPADPARARAAELGPEHVQAVWAPSASDPDAGVAVARAAGGELRVVTVRPRGSGGVLIGLRDGAFEVRFQASIQGLHIDVAPTVQPGGASPFSWACFANCFVDHARACLVSCSDCARSGFTVCTPCYECLGYWGVYCSLRC